MSKEIRDILAVARGACTLATVVRVVGSSYRKPGARMLVTADGVVAGSVSGGCLEGEIVRRGRWWAEAGPVVRTFTSEAEPGDDERSATGCGGRVDVLIENVDADDPRGTIAALRRVVAERAPARLAIALPDGDVFVDHIEPPRELLVAGRHHDVAPLVRMARLLGWETTVAAGGVAGRALGEPDQVIALDPASVAGWARARPDAAVVIMTHSLALDRELVAALDGAALAYLGVLGPRHRLGDAAGAVRSPVGLDLGGDGPEAIALSIVADLQATWHGRSAARLCDGRPRARLVSLP